MGKVKRLETLEEKIEYMDKIGVKYWLPNRASYPDN